MTADSGPYSKKARKTTESEKLIATFERGITKLILGAIKTDTISSSRNPKLSPVGGKLKRLSRIARLPKNATETLVEVNSPVLLIKKS